MGKFRDYNPALKFGNKIYPEDLAIGDPWANYFYVDGDNGSDTANNGSAVDKPTATIQQAVDNAAAGDVIYVRPKAPGIWDPVAYAEAVTIPYTKPHLSIIGSTASKAFGALPLINTGDTNASITVRAPGCRISGLSMANSGSTSGGGVLLDDDASTKAAYGTTVDNCYLYECPHAGAVTGGGGVYWSAQGNAWQIRIIDNRFVNCGAGVSLLNTTGSRPTDVVIQGNSFSSWANTYVDCDIYLKGGSGVQALLIDNNNFGTVDGCNAAFAEDHYMNLTGCEGLVSNNTFAAKSGSEDTPLSWGASTHTGAIVPATVRMAGNHGEGAVGSKGNATGLIFRTD